MKGTGQKPGGSWIQQNYEKLALLLALVVLLGSVLLLLLRVGEQRKGFDTRMEREAVTTGAAAEPLDLSASSNLIAALQQPFQVAAAQRRMMVGELRVASIPDGAPIPFDAKVDPFNNKPQPDPNFDPDTDGDGIPDKVELSMGLNPADPSDALGDLDGDGYTNVEEHQSGSNMKDPAITPPASAKLRLLRTVVNPFRLRFLGISKLPDGDRYQLNVRSLERTYFARIGDEIEGFKVVSYQGDAAGGPTITLERESKSIRLIQGRVINEEDRTAFVVFLITGARYKLQVNQEFRLQGDLYKVVDIREDRIVIRDARDGKLITVGLLSPEERARLQGASQAAPAQPPVEPAPLLP